ncbi:GerW family sporulation protein [Alicyclobacillus cycloheptanicus]|jgi:sporulation protein YtfJ|uniref:Sporulation protein YtfJ n=1 Tax=Alicyclobacillus cycloheptanicus TaxID=1457 RepID=A0ABT9XE42_9BACL|nr:GerW family sporulation protein [Alicyclobacillus cycloheptanicus]MDQ0188447.1 sporulation protein YtfJ [Alicyclobacillus cycloheptanicus]WDM01143.1 GerW family sporulation protein [Alicyclobacillus cycloheptanicus]
MDHPIQGLMQTAMTSIREMVDVNTIIGDPVETPDGTVILPVSRVGFGFAAGGSQFQTGDSKAGSTDSDHPFGGGSGGGVNIVPIGFLIVQGNQVRLLSTDNQNQLYDRLIDMAPVVVEKIQSMLRGQSSPNSTAQPQGPNLPS